eukprot:8938888-Alexandrium_andersonii.AAC.1
MHRCAPASGCVLAHVRARDAPGGLLHACGRAAHGMQSKYAPVSPLLQRHRMGTNALCRPSGCWILLQR